MDVQILLMSLMLMAVGRAMVDILTNKAHWAMPLGVGKMIQRLGVDRLDVGQEMRVYCFG
jgi:hypothetical protein